MLEAKLKPTLLAGIFLTLIPLTLLTISPIRAVSSGLQTQTGASERPALDQLVDVGGYRLYIKCIGNGTPTVILEAGLGGDSSGWSKVMPDVGKFTRF